MSVTRTAPPHCIAPAARAALPRSVICSMRVLTLGLKHQAAAERIFKALAEKGTVEMALQETFWAVRFGVVVFEYENDVG